MKALSRRRTAGAVLSAAALLALVGIAVWHHHTGTHVHEHDTAVLSLDEGKRWQTDAPLRAGFREIRTAAAPVLAAYSRQHLTAEQARAFADAVTANFATMAKACQLPPKADATLHALVVELLHGAGLLAEDPRSREGFDAVRNVLRQYPEYFDDPEWIPFAAPET